MAAAELLTTPPVRPPSTPFEGNPLIDPVTGMLVANVMTLDNTKPSSTVRSTLFDIFLVKSGVQTMLPAKRCRWSRSDNAFSCF